MDVNIKGKQLARIFYNMPKREKRTFFNYITKNADSDLLDMIDTEIINNRINEPMNNYEAYSEKRIIAGK